jgi:hypothetical protein
MMSNVGAHKTHYFVDPLSIQEWPGERATAAIMSAKVGDYVAVMVRAEVCPSGQEDRADELIWLEIDEIGRGTETIGLGADIKGVVVAAQHTANHGCAMGDKLFVMWRDIRDMRRRGSDQSYLERNPHPAAPHDEFDQNFLRPLNTMFSAKQLARWQDGKRKIAVAFRTLRERGYITKMDWQCCMSCGFAAIEEYHGPVSKLVFYHGQAAANLLEDGSCYLNWSGNGREIVDTLKRHGLKVKWSGGAYEGIKITIPKRKTPRKLPRQFKLQS